MGIENRRWCVRATDGNVSYPISLHRTWWGAWRYRHRATVLHLRKARRYLLVGYEYPSVTYRVDRATNRDRAELDGWVS